MFNFDTFKQKSPQQRFLFILGLVMFLVYLTLGVYIIADKTVMTQFPQWSKILFGALLIGYAIIRFTRLINQKED